MTENKTVTCSMQGACLWPTTSDCEIRRFEVGNLKIQSKTAVMIFKNFLSEKSIASAKFTVVGLFGNTLDS